MSEPGGRAARRLERAHGRQRRIAWLMAPFWVPLVPLYLRFVRGLRVAARQELRASFRRIRRETRGPLLVCANHLTMIDSFIVSWALGSPGYYLWDFDAWPWNTPERSNFATGRLQSIMTYLAKCVPIQRGGSRSEVAGVLARMTYLLGRGELALIFPEGGRSRTGRVDLDSPAWGVGRIVGALPDCRVLCVYMRGDAQTSYSHAPPRGDMMRLRLECIEPKSDARGVRRTRDLANQIVAQIAKMETEYFDGRQ